MFTQNRKAALFGNWTLCDIAYWQSDKA